MRRRICRWVLVASCGISTACSSSEPPSGSSGTGPGTGPGTSGEPASPATPTERTGETKCGDDETCQAGQYCESAFLGCKNGCLANTNCAADQTCVKFDGLNVGSCQNDTTATTPRNDAGRPTPNCNAFCSKLEMCDPPGWNAMLARCSGQKGRACACSDICLEVRSDCIDCVDSAETCGDAKLHCTASCG